MIKTNSLLPTCELAHDGIWLIWSFPCGDTRWAVSISKMETSLIPNAENSRRQRLAAHSPRDRRTKNFEAVVLERFDGSGDFCSHFSETLFTLDFNSCRSFTSVSYWSLINCTDFFFVRRQVGVVFTCYSSSSPSPCLFSLLSSFSVSFCIFYI